MSLSNTNLKELEHSVTFASSRKLLENGSY